MVRGVGSEVKSSIFGLMTMMTQTLSEVSDHDVERFADILLSHREGQILVLGAGRSGLVGRAFALRLLHLGFRVNVLGDTLVPSIGSGDLVLAISGTGTTKLVLTAVEAAKYAGAEVAAITSFAESSLGQIADIVVQLKGRVKELEKDEDSEGRDYFARQILGLHEPLAPLGTLFEDSCMVLLDAMITVLMGRLKLSEEEMKKRHANIE